MRKFLFVSIFILLGASLGAGGSFWFINHAHSEKTEYSSLFQKHHGKKGHEGEKHSAKMMGATEMHASGQHDEVNMPGLQGVDTTEGEVQDLKTLFQMHQNITRTVINIPNGIKTVTESEEETLRDSIVNHVTMMVTRLEEGRNPEVMIQSPTLDKLFALYSDITTEMEMTDKGIAVIQTSDNPEAVRLLQTHASEVSDMAKRGMQAVHERMMSTSSEHGDDHHGEGHHGKGHHSGSHH